MPDLLHYLQSHKPSLDSGQYTVTATQTIEGTTFTRTLTFEIPDDLHPFPSGAIVERYPPAGAVGAFGDVLPHVVLRSSTMPWTYTEERRLALVISTSDEVPTSLTDDKKGFAEVRQRLVETTLEEVQRVFDGKSPTWIMADHHSDPAGDTERDVAYDSRSGQSFERHVQTGGNEVFYAVEAETAVVVAGTHPKPDRNVAHLVSIDPDDPHKVQSLARWEFTSTTGAGGSFGQIAEKLAPGTLGRSVDGAAQCAAPLLVTGYVPLRHTFRQGDRTVSWYHGPFVGAVPETTDPPAYAETADRLLRYDRETGLFDASYAAAWTLGRLLTLRKQQVALDIYTWKRRCRHLNASERHLLELGFDLPRTRLDGLEADRIDRINRWFEDLSVLRGVPPSYLVPHADLLPADSLRFFEVDPRWLRALRDGALAVGRTTLAEVKRDSEHKPSEGDVQPHPPSAVAGVLLRSAMVDAFPRLQVLAWEAGQTPSAGDEISAPVPPLRREGHGAGVLLSPGVLLVLFDKAIGGVDLALPHASLHYELTNGVPSQSTGRIYRFAKET